MCCCQKRYHCFPCKTWERKIDLKRKLEILKEEKEYLEKEIEELKKKLGEE